MTPIFIPRWLADLYVAFNGGPLPPQYEIVDNLPATKE